MTGFFGVLLILDSFIDKECGIVSNATYEVFKTLDEECGLYELAIM